MVGLGGEDAGSKNQNLAGLRRIMGIQTGRVVGEAIADRIIGLWNGRNRGLPHFAGSSQRIGPPLRSRTANCESGGTESGKATRTFSSS